MRALNRPMFRYGGNVKAQGVMHRMKNMQDGGPATMADATGYANGGMSNNQGPRRAALVGNPAYSVGPDGRTKHVAPILVGAGMGIARLAPLAMRAGRGIKNFYQGFKGAKTFAPGDLGFGGRLKDLVLGGGRFRSTPATVKRGGERIASSGSYSPVTMTPGVPKGLFQSLKDPRLLGAAAREYPILAGSLGFGALGIPRNTGNILGGIGTGVKNVGQAIANQALGTEFGKEKPPVLKKAAPGERGSLLKTEGTTRELTTVEKEDKDKERLAKIYKLLGVDRSQRNAASKALVDVSRYIDEGGKDTVSKKNIGSTISKAISSFDKRLDKSDQLKEAAGVMMAKSYLEGGDKAQDRRYKQVMIDAKLKEMNPEFATVKASYSKTMSGDDLISAAASTTFKDAFGGTLMNSKKFNKAMKEAEGTATEMDAILQIATNELNQIEARDGEGTIPAGYYAVGDKVVRINSKGVADKVVG